MNNSIYKNFRVVLKNGRLLFDLLISFICLNKVVGQTVHRVVVIDALLERPCLNLSLKFSVKAYNRLVVLQRLFGSRETSSKGDVQKVS